MTMEKYIPYIVLFFVMLYSLANIYEGCLIYSGLSCDTPSGIEYGIEKSRARVWSSITSLFN